MNAPFRRLEALLLGSESRARLARAVSGSAGLRLIGVGLTFLVGLQLARGLGPAGYGQYGLAMSIVSILMVPTEFGLPLLVMREVAFAESVQDRRLAERLMRWAALVVSASAFAMAAGLALAVDFHVLRVAGPISKALYWATLLLPLVALANLFSAGLRGLHRLVQGQVAELLVRPGLLCILLASYAMLAPGPPLNPGTVMALNVAAALVSAIYAMALCMPQLRRMPQVEEEISEGHNGPRYWLSSALALASGEGMRVIAGNSAVLVLGIASTVGEVGIYKVAFGIFAMSAVTQALLTQTCSPAIAKLYIEGRFAALAELNRWLAGLLFASAVVCLAPFVFAGGAIIDVVFGHAYRGALTATVILLGGQAVNALLGHPMVVLNTIRHERAVTAFSAIALGLNIGGCFLLAPRWGAEGAAAAAVGSELVWRSACWVYACRRLRIDTSILAFLPRRGTAPDEEIMSQNSGVET